MQFNDEPPPPPPLLLHLLHLSCEISTVLFLLCRFTAVWLAGQPHSPKPFCLCLEYSARNPSTEATEKLIIEKTLVNYIELMLPYKWWT